MTYSVRLSKKVQKQLRKLDNATSTLILRYLNTHIEGIENPRSKGKGLVGNHSGKWRYRVGDYRVVCEIIDDELIVLAISVGHRKDVY